MRKNLSGQGIGKISLFGESDLGRDMSSAVEGKGAV